MTARDLAVIVLALLAALVVAGALSPSRPTVPGVQPQAVGVLV